MNQGSKFQARKKYGLKRYEKRDKIMKNASHHQNNLKMQNFKSEQKNKAKEAPKSILSSVNFTQNSISSVYQQLYTFQV